MRAADFEPLLVGLAAVLGRAWLFAADAGFALDVRAEPEPPPTFDHVGEEGLVCFLVEVVDISRPLSCMVAMREIAQMFQSTTIISR